MREKTFLAAKHFSQANQLFFILLTRPLWDTFVNHYYKENKATVRARVCTLLKQIFRINALINFYDLQIPLSLTSSLFSINMLIPTNLATILRWGTFCHEELQWICVHFCKKSKHIMKSQDTTRSIEQFLELENRQRNAKIRTWTNTYEKTDLSTAWKHNTSNSIQNPENP